jgi:hypothetical protein
MVCNHERRVRSVEENQTWELTDLPEGKKAVGCKWVFTLKQSTEGKIERYNAKMVARGYSQTYGIDYDETFAHVAKMNIVRILISCVANFRWTLHQLDVMLSCMIIFRKRCIWRCHQEKCAN